MASSDDALHGTVHGGEGQGCVEVFVTTDTSRVPHKAGEPRLYVMRNSADPQGPSLYFTEAEWEAFILGVRDGEFDLDESGNFPEVPGGPDAAAGGADEAPDGPRDSARRDGPER